MKVLSLFRRKPAAARDRQGPLPSTSSARTASHLRREMVTMALRDTVHRHGIPKDWLATDTLLVRGPRGEFQCYVRILLTRWEPRLLAHASAFEASFVRRLSLLDGTSQSWLRGISWQLGGDRPGFPTTMPPPAVWQDEVPAQPVEASAPVAANERRAELGLLFSERDQKYQRAVEGDNADFQPTQPFLQ